MELDQAGRLLVRGVTEHRGLWRVENTITRLTVECEMPGRRRTMIKLNTPADDDPGLDQSGICTHVVRRSDMRMNMAGAGSHPARTIDIQDT